MLLCNVKNHDVLYKSMRVLAEYVKMENTMMESGNNCTAVIEKRSLIGRLLSIANQYRTEGHLRQATEIYWTLVEAHSGTAQADAAREVLLELADEYESTNARRMARSIYERLMAMEK